MTWIGVRVRDDAVLAAYAEVADMADWSDWLPFAAGVAESPRLPGVYRFREPEPHVIRYVGMAGEAGYRSTGPGSGR